MKTKKQSSRQLCKRLLCLSVGNFQFYGIAGAKHPPRDNRSEKRKPLCDAAAIEIMKNN